MKICKRCLKDETIVTFEKSRKLCKSCRSDDHNAYYIKNKSKFKQWAIEWSTENPEKRKKIVQKWRYKSKDQLRERYLFKRFGITLDDFNRLVKLQNSVCKICDQPEKVNKNLNVDHCHKTGKIRGLLCTGCNTALGSFNDEKSNLERAIKYLNGEL